MKLYFQYFKLHLKSTLQYKKSFILSFVSQIFIFFTYYFTIIALFAKFNNIKGFSVYEVLLSFSIIQFGFSFIETFFKGIDHFDELIISGEFDNLLIKPRKLLFQVMCYKIDVIKLARIIQSIIILVIALIKLSISWNFLKVLTLIFMIISSIIIFYSIFLFAASYCFFTIKGLEVRNLFTDGGKQMAQYPIGIFKKGFVFFFTFIIPYGFVNYYPLLYFLGKNDYILYGFSPAFVFIFFGLSIFAFNKGCKKYTSCGC